MSSGDDHPGEPRPRVMVVDDQPAYRELLSEILGDEGYEVVTATGGEEALDLAAKAVPDLVLLDVSMPGMSGLDVCRRLKESPETAPVPVVLVTALAERENRLQGIAAGANDYLAKPIDQLELRLRVRNALALRRLHRETQEQYRRLRELEALRDGLVHMVIHDLRAPLTAMLMHLGLLREDAAAAGSGGAALLESIDGVESSARHMAGLVNTVLDVHRLESGAMPLKLVEVELESLVRQAVSAVSARVQDRTVSLTTNGSPARLLVDATLIQRVIANLLDNALKFARDSEVEVLVEARGEGARLSVRDHGPGIAREFHERVFEKFGQVEAARAGVVTSSGLGLAFCKLAVEMHGGRIGVISRPGEGSTFWFELPRTIIPARSTAPGSPGTR